MARQFIYHMQGLSKTYPGNRKVLENIHLSILSGRQDRRARRQRLGQVDAAAHHGRASTRNSPARPGRPRARASAILPQEPQLDATKTVRENVMEGVAAKSALLDRYNEIAANYSDETADEMAKLQDEIDSQNLWDLDSQVDQAMDALRCPPDDAEVEHALRRRAAPRRALQAAAGGTRAAAARRAHQPSRRRDGGLAGGASCATIRARS